MKKLLLPLMLLLSGCASTTAQTPDYRAIAQQYFSIYAERQDFEVLMGMFAEDAQLEDMIYGFHAKDKKAIRAFLNWNDGKFQMPDGPPALVVEKQTVDGNIAVTEGHFPAFVYDGKNLGPWRFVIWLEFDDNGKIIREVDWINYTPREGFLGGKNMNELIRL